MRLRRGALFLLWITGASWPAGGPAHAGAWTRAEGDGQLIVTTARRVAPADAWTGGITTDDTSYSQIYVEYGWEDDLTIGGVIYTEVDALDIASSTGSVGLFVRQRLWQGQHGDVFSVQVGASHPIEQYVLEEYDVVPTGSNAFEVQVRALYGKGWGFDWGNAFVSLEGGYHWRDGEADELRFDATAGIEPIKGVLGIMSVYSLTPLGGGTDASLKLAPSVAWTMLPWIGRDGKKPRGPISADTVQFGVIYDVLEEDRGLTLQISVWRPF